MPSDIEQLCLAVDGAERQELIKTARRIEYGLSGSTLREEDIDRAVIRRLTELAQCKRLSIPCASAAALVGECPCKTCFSYGRVMRWLKGMETMP